MKLYMHPASTTSRAVVLFVTENNIPCEMQVVDIFAGEHLKEPFAKINPNKLIPVLEDGDFRLTESSAILKYLAEKANSPAYPKELQPRARVNEVMDWLNANFYRDYGYGLIYPQAFPGHQRRSDEAHAATIEWGKEKTEGWLRLLNDHIIGSNKFLCGSEITIADYFGFAIVQVGELIRCSFAGYPNVARWLDTMHGRPGAAKVYEVIKGFAEQMKGKEFIAL
ncbi:MAG TPA: glutathione S-transferase family protein [Stellaceae bacterium]|jgi:glutathione S-transferase|nr:glutathione S-transferase family protein [Stellaceae bacterium]